MRQTVVVSQDLELQGPIVQFPLFLDFSSEYVKVKEVIYVADESKGEAKQLASVMTDMIQNHQPLTYFLTQTEVVSKDIIFPVDPAIRGRSQRFTVISRTPPRGRLVMTLEFISRE